MEELNEKQILEKAEELNSRHQKLKEEILERSLLNEKAILELSQIEIEYKLIIENLKTFVKEV